MRGALLATALAAACAVSPVQALTVGSKKFTESVILAEIAVQLLRADGVAARHERELGGTTVLWNALLAGDIDAYAEYSGTLTREILAGERIESEPELRQALARHGVGIAVMPGFNNSYVLGMKEERAGELDIRRISDLAGQPRLRLGLSNEFLDRGDGWPALRARYALPQVDVRGLDHAVAYRALDAGELDIIDLYSTDAEIGYYGIRPLTDDLGFFPSYEAMILYREAAGRDEPEALRVLSRLDGRINEARMIAMNAAVKMDRQPEASVAASYLETEFGVKFAPDDETRMQRLRRTTADHLFLVGLSLGAAILAAIPLGILAVRMPRFGRAVLAVAGMLQTIPSLALLVFMIPVFGIGGRPAVAALFLYSLLPIIRGTHSGLSDVPAAVRESAVALGLPSGARLWLIELPLATRSILSGIKTSAVINVGTATLGALIGAGGYGQPILTGIRLDDTALILEGAVPAALMALLAQGIFDLVEHRLLPRGLRYRTVA